MGDEIIFQAAILLSACGNQSAAGVPGSVSKYAAYLVANRRCEAMPKCCNGNLSDGRQGAGGTGL
jgi:hypothetical protein